jgi:predicted permease
MVVATLALGVGANAAMLSVLSGIFGAPAGLQDPSYLRRLYLSPDASPEPGVVPRARDEFSYPEVSSIEQMLGSEQMLAVWSEPEEKTVARGESPQSARVTFVSEDFFAALGVPVARGRFFAAGEGAVEAPTRVVVLSHAFWQRAFSGDPDALGATLAVEDTAYTVIGIAAEGFRGLDVTAADLFLPIGAFPAQGQRGLAWYQWGSGYFQLATRLPSAMGEAELLERATVGYRAQPDIRGYRTDRSLSMLAGPIVEARGPGYVDGSVPISVRIAGVTGMVLLIACANVVNLLLVRSSRRRREIAVRLALGVSRGRLFRQLLTESVVLAALAGGAACLVGSWGGSILRGVLLPDTEWARPVVEPFSLALVMLGAAGCGVLVGVASGMAGTRTIATAAFRASGSGGGRRNPVLRTGLLAAQGALSMVLLVGAGLFVRSLGELDALDLGYDTDQLVRASVSIRGGDPDPTPLRETAAVLAATRGVTGVALASSTPMGGWSSSTIFLDGRTTPISSPSPSYNQVTPEFFDVAGMSLLAGRSFERGESGVAVVNQTLAELIAPGGDAIGQCLRLGDANAACTRVVGVSENARRGMVLIEEPRPLFFLPLGDRVAVAASGPGVLREPTAILIRVDGDPRSVAATARAELERSFDPGVVRVDRISDALAPQLRPWRLGAQLFTAFGVLALLVTAVGFYSVMAYSVQQRTHEMGVRIALGARVHDVVRLVLREGVGVVLLGVLAGVGVALALGRLVESLLYGVNARDPVAMAAAGAVLLAVGVAACLVPAVRATRVDPVRALSAE